MTWPVLQARETGAEEIKEKKNVGHKIFDLFTFYVTFMIINYRRNFLWDMNFITFWKDEML